MQRSLYAKKPKRFKCCAQFTLAFLGLILLVTMTIFAVNELTKKYTENNEDYALVRVLYQTFRSSAGTAQNEQRLTVTTAPTNSNEFLLERDASVVQLRQERAALESATTNYLTAAAANASKTSNKSLAYSTSAMPAASKSVQGYYEEQSPVVLHAESGPILAYRQSPYVPTQQNSAERDPYYDAAFASNERADDYDDTVRDYDQDQVGQQADYEPQDSGYYSGEQPPDYYGDEAAAADATDAKSAKAVSTATEPRASTNRQYDAYYRQWHFATTPPALVFGSATNSRDLGDKRKLQQRPYVGQTNRDPYNTYPDVGDYEYSRNRPQQKQQQSSYNPQRQSVQLYRQRLQSQQNHPTNPPTVTTTQRPQEHTLLTVVRQLKNMWDIYQAFTTAWNALAEHSQKTQQLQLEKQKQREQQQQQLRINSRQPPKFSATKKRTGTTTKPTKATTTKTTKPTKATTTRTKSTTTKSTTIKATTVTTTAIANITALPPAKNEPRNAPQGDAGRKQDMQSAREKRQLNDFALNVEQQENQAVGNETAVAEGRYIKGDPLKGYYDFVITEGSYKFWAVFQVGTAILIIYSTFAAIYYSKVNPLVSDYDYTDYLGGARALSDNGGDLDFVDDGDDAAASDKNTRTSRWLDWMPHMEHSVKFILDAIDKLPTDHKQKEKS